MCEPTDENDSRRKEGSPGWYCCHDSTWNPEEAGFCRTCSRPQHHPKAPAPTLRLAMAFADDEPPCSDPDCRDCAARAARQDELEDEPA